MTREEMIKKVCEEHLDCLVYVDLDKQRSWCVECDGYGGKNRSTIDHDENCSAGLAEKLLITKIVDIRKGAK